MPDPVRVIFVDRWNGFFMILRDQRLLVCSHYRSLAKRGERTRRTASITFPYLDMVRVTIYLSCGLFILRIIAKQSIRVPATATGIRTSHSYDVRDLYNNELPRLPRFPRLLLLQERIPYFTTYVLQGSKRHSAHPKTRTETRSSKQGTHFLVAMQIVRAPALSVLSR